MAYNKNDLSWLLARNATYCHYSNREFYTTSDNNNTTKSFPLVFFYGEGEKLQEQNQVTDFVYKTPLYAKNRDLTIFPVINYPRYKSLLLNIIHKFCPASYRGYTPYEMVLTFVENCLIGKGIILDENMEILLAIEGDIKRKEDQSTVASNFTCKIDYKVFNDKSKVCTFIKNTLLPVLINNKYPIKIDDFSKVDVFNHPIGPSSFDYEEEVYNTLINHI